MTMTVEMVASRDAVETAGEAGGAYVAYLDQDVRVCGASAGLLGTLGVSSSEVTGMHFGEMLHPSVREVVLRQLDMLAAGSRRQVATRFLGLDNGSSPRLAGRLLAVAVQTEDEDGHSIVALVQSERSPAEQPGASSDRKKPLSELDARVLEGVAAGSSTTQLAGRLYLSRQGVEYHVGAMLRRFRCANRSALVAKAYAQGVLTVGQWPPGVVADYVR